MPIKVTALLLMMVFAQPAQAGLCGTFLDPMSVSASTLAFSNYLASAKSDSTASISIACGLLGIDLLPSFTIALSAGASGTPAARTMKMGSRTLAYNIYTSSGYSSVWGDGTNGSSVVTFNGGLLHLGTTTFTAFGRVPAGQYVVSGVYSDTLVVTVTF